MDDYGRDELHSALDEALKQQSPYPQTVQQILERRRDEKRQPPPLAVAVPDKVKPYCVKAVNLADYDQLNPSHEDGPVNDSETEQDKDKEKKKKKAQKKEPEPENAITAITKEENHD
ncbi:hypothetical protein [Methylotuvimicrobium sp.]|uniref:hypothetical protein n=1 Tax=Methylotuvimicrobium sp. TaxID=2822413 RepID=UPI003D65B453